MDGQSSPAKYWNVHEEVLQEELHFLRLLNKLMTKVHGPLQTKMKFERLKHKRADIKMYTYLPYD